MEDKAKVDEIKNICPLCEEERGPNCMQPLKPATLCLSSYGCQNKEGEIRTGCQGYLRGNIGFSLMLGNNILTDKEWVTKQTTSDENWYTRVRLNDYKKKIISRFPEVDKNTLDEETRDFTQKHSKTHPLGKAGGVQAHHLICSEAMKNEEWRDLVNVVGYNNDCVLNGVYLPSATNLACTARVPLHKGDHDDGVAGSTNYPERVVSEISQILSMARKWKPCEKSEEERKKIAKQIVNELNKKSDLIFQKIKLFVWTITWDGFDYMPGNPIGCGNVKSPKEKSGKKKEIKEGKITDAQKQFTDQRTDRVTINMIEAGREENIKKFHEILEEEDVYGELCCKQTRNHGKKKQTLGITSTNQYILKIGE